MNVKNWKMTNSALGTPIIRSDALDDCYSWSQEAIRHFNQTAALKQMLSLVDNYLNLDDEVRSFWILIPNTREFWKLLKI